jgi:uncharacterized protein YndB with AHSA1/START domain
MEVCATDVILAPAERVWRLLTNPHELAQWSGTKLVEGPARAVSAGDRLVFRAGMLHITFDVLDMQASRQLTLDIALPFGIKNREQMQITPIDANSCRTTFKWAVSFPPGWRGQLLEMVFGRRFVTGPAKSLGRLKRAAEQRPIPSSK